MPIFKERKKEEEEEENKKAKKEMDELLADPLKDPFQELVDNLVQQVDQRNNVSNSTNSTKVAAQANSNVEVKAYVKKEEPKTQPKVTEIPKVKVDAPAGAKPPPNPVVSDKELEQVMRQAIDAGKSQKFDKLINEGANLAKHEKDSLVKNIVDQSLTLKPEDK